MPGLEKALLELRKHGIRLQQTTARTSQRNRCAIEDFLDRSGSLHPFAQHILHSEIRRPLTAVLPWSQITISMVT
ncbi:hypothetical protein [Verminephrobacter eiseniae]|uniref:hypothetical protein n=1 Tax=Verminephrobacter eiseniae TaxID=364317 RepID=UPI002237D3E7|nr:hypothetical protein [Verminephrobacter eiseniae]